MWGPRPVSQDHSKDLPMDIGPGTSFINPVPASFTVGMGTDPWRGSLYGSLAEGVIGCLPGSAALSSKVAGLSTSKACLGFGTIGVSCLLKDSPNGQTDGFRHLLSKGIHLITELNHPRVI